MCSAAIRRAGCWWTARGSATSGAVVLRDRQILAEDGHRRVALTVDRKGALVVAGPEIASRGVDLRQGERAAAGRAAGGGDRDALAERAPDEPSDREAIGARVRSAVRQFINQRFQRKPVVLPDDPGGLMPASRPRRRPTSPSRPVRPGPPSEPAPSRAQDAIRTAGCARRRGIVAIALAGFGGDLAGRLRSRAPAGRAGLAGGAGRAVAGLGAVPCARLRGLRAARSCSARWGVGGLRAAAGGQGLGAAGRPRRAAAGHGRPAPADRRHLRGHARDPRRHRRHRGLGRVDAHRGHARHARARSAPGCCC